MSREDLIRFARRDWTAIGQAKDQHWLRQKRAQSGPDAWRRVDDWLRYVRAATGASPSMTDRLTDVHVHAHVGRALRAVTHPTR